MLDVILHCFPRNIGREDNEHYKYKLLTLQDWIDELQKLLDQIACPTARYRPGVGSRGRSAAQSKKSHC